MAGLSVEVISSERRQSHQQIAVGVSPWDADDNREFEPRTRRRQTLVRPFRNSPARGGRAWNTTEPAFEAEHQKSMLPPLTRLKNRQLTTNIRRLTMDNDPLPLPHSNTPARSPPLRARTL